MQDNSVFALNYCQLVCYIVTTLEIYFYVCMYVSYIQ